jgi:hypothetical protein
LGNFFIFLKENLMFLVAVEAVVDRTVDTVVDTAVDTASQTAICFKIIY